MCIVSPLCEASRQACGLIFFWVFTTSWGNTMH
jgi:hypothetical protein